MDNVFITEGNRQLSFPMEESAYCISDDLYDEALSLDPDKMMQELINSYRLSGRYWVWRQGVSIYRKSWKGMFDDGEMRMEAPGYKNLKMYPTLKSLEEEYERLHPDKAGITSRPPAYYAFANYLRKGDVVVVCVQNEIVGWGVIEGNYTYRQTRESGNHYRLVSWHTINMPFIFMSKRSALYQIPAEQTYMLKETLVSKTIANGSSLPLPFTTHENSPKSSLVSKGCESVVANKQNNNFTIMSIVQGLLSSFHP